MQERLPLGNPFLGCRTARFFHEDAVPFVVIDRVPAFVQHPKPIDEGIEAEVFSMAGEDVLAERKLLMRQSHLPQQRRRYIRLTAVCLNYFRLLYGSAQPEYRHVIPPWLIFLHVVGIAIPMVGHEDDQQVIPDRRLPYLVDKGSEATVREGHGVQIRVLQPVIGNLEGLVAAQRQEGGHPRLGISLSLAQYII